MQIKASVAAVRNIRGLPSAEDFQKHGAFTDLFDFLQYCFGFQVLQIHAYFLQFLMFRIFFLTIQVTCFHPGRECGQPEGTSYSASYKYSHSESS